MKKPDLNLSRKAIAIYDDANLFVDHAQITAGTSNIRKQFLGSIEAMADLCRYGTEEDLAHVGDMFEEYSDAFSEAFKQNGGINAVKDAQAKRKLDKDTPPCAAELIRNGKNYTGEKMRTAFIKRNLFLEINRGQLEITPLTPEQVKQLNGTGTTGIARHRTAKSIMADKNKGNQSGTADAQKPAPQAKQVNMLEQAGELVKQMDLTQLKLLLKVVESAIRVEERQKAVTGRQRTASQKQASQKQTGSSL